MTVQLLICAEKQVGYLQREVSTIVQEREEHLKRKYESVIRHLQQEIAQQTRSAASTPTRLEEVHDSFILSYSLIFHLG